jgi:hypothetical protein
MTDEELKARTDDARTALARTLVGHIRRLDDNASITILARAFGAIADASSNASTELAKEAIVAGATFEMLGQSLKTLLGIEHVHSGVMPVMAALVEIERVVRDWQGMPTIAQVQTIYQCLARLDAIRGRALSKAG